MLAQLETGYPRFFIALVVRELAQRLLRYVDFQQAKKTPSGGATVLVAAPGRNALLYPAEIFAKHCYDYLKSRNNRGFGVSVFRVNFDGWVRTVEPSSQPRQGCDQRNVFAVVFPEELTADARAFWQHTGLGISSRFAQYWLENAPFLCGDKAKGDFLKEIPPRYSTISRTLHQRIASLISSKENVVEGGEIFVYQSGMAAMNTIALTLRALRPKIFPNGVTGVRVAIFGSVSSG